MWMQLSSQWLVVGPRKWVRKYKLKMYLEFQTHDIYSLSKIIPEAEGVSMKSCKGKQYSGVIFGD